MKVKVKFRDTEFGLFEPSFTVPVIGSAERFRGIYLDFVADGVPWSQLVLDRSISRHEMLDDTLDENPVYAAASDGVYWLIERIMDPQLDEGEEVEIEYEGEDMEDRTTHIEIPADAKTVTLELKKHCTFTLRSLLPQIKDEVELVVRDEFGTNTKPDADLYSLRAGGGNTLLRKLARSRVVEGESILDLTPSVKLVRPEPTMLNGTFATLTGTGYIQLTVTPPVPNEGD